MKIYIKNLNDGKAPRKDMNMYKHEDQIHLIFSHFHVEPFFIWHFDFPWQINYCARHKTANKPHNRKKKYIYSYILPNQYIYSCFLYYSDLNILHHWFSDPFPKPELMKYANRLLKWMGMVLILRHDDTECNLKMTATCSGLYFWDYIPKDNKSMNLLTFHIN